MDFGSDDCNGWSKESGFIVIWVVESSIGCTAREKAFDRDGELSAVSVFG